MLLIWPLGDRTLHEAVPFPRGRRKAASIELKTAEVLKEEPGCARPFLFLKGL